MSPQVLEVPNQSIEFKLNDKSDVVEVYAFYISKYPESNIEYKTFLISLPITDRETALPTKESLKAYSLSDAQLEFLSSEYYSSEEYDNYPIIGLSKSQIQDYLEWKIDTTGKQILINNGISFDPTKTYFEIVQELDLKPRYLQVEYHVLTEAQAMAVRMFMESENSYTIDTEDTKSNNSILESLKIQELEYYRLELNNEKGELVQNQSVISNYYEKYW